MRFWCTVLSVFFSISFSFAAIVDDKLEDDIKNLEKSIEVSVKKLQRIKGTLGQNINHAPLAVRHAWLEKDYDRYPPNHYYDTFKYIHPHEPYELEFHFWGQADQHTFADAYGLYIKGGSVASPILNRNTVSRYWLRRARPSIEGEFYDFFNYFVNVSFGEQEVQLYDAFIDINYYRLLGFQIGLQMSLVSGVENFFDNFDYVSRAFTMEMSNSAMLAPDRQFGFIAHGSFGPSGDEPYFRGLSLLGFDDMFSYQFGWLSDTPDNSTPLPTFDFIAKNSLDQQFDLSTSAFEGRIFINPFIDRPHFFLHHLGLGFATSLGHPSDQSGLPILESVGQNPIYRYSTTDSSLFKVLANGSRYRLHPQMVWGYGAIGLLADWTQTTQNLSVNKRSASALASTYDPPLYTLTQTNSANQISLIYNVTQEEFNLFHFIPNAPFHFFEKDAYGGWQVVFRISGLNLDPDVFNSKYTLNLTEKGKKYSEYYFADPRISVQKANTWSIGFNWYWNQFFRISSEYDQTTFVGGCSSDALNPSSGQTSGCLTNAGIDGRNADTFLSSNQVLNRPTEKIFMTRVQVQF